MPLPASLTLLLPGLLWPRQALADLVRGLALPSFSFIAGRATRHRDVAATWHAELARRAGLGGPLPFAALRRGATGQPGNASLLCLDPVQLTFAERRLVLADPSLLALSAEESASLAAALAPTFASFGRLEPGAPGQWHLVLADGVSPPSLLPPDEAVGEAVHDRLGGTDSNADHKAWWRLLNEAQMRLHAHPVNQAREAKGQPVANSLWPWGFSPAGVPPQLSEAWMALRPAAFTMPGSDALLLLDGLSGSRQRGDGLAWRTALEDIEGEWLTPALAAWRQRRLSALDLLIPDIDGGLRLHLGQSERWRFWCGPAAVEGLA